MIYRTDTIGKAYYLVGCAGYALVGSALGSDGRRGALDARLQEHGDMAEGVVERPGDRQHRGVVPETASPRADALPILPKSNARHQVLGTSSGTAPNARNALSALQTSR